MCGRYALTCTPDRIAEEFQLEEIPDIHPRYNVAPSQWVACVRAGRHARTREAVTLRWGLIPSWARDHAMGMKLINARVETVAKNHRFKSRFGNVAVWSWRTATMSGNGKAQENSLTIFD